ncbi:MAG: DEAD/DEAH box helicase family protein [Phycisphaerales bacterium]
MSLNEADTCRKFVIPALQAAGWDTAPREIAEQRTFTDGRVIPSSRGARRRKGKRADYLLRYSADLTVAVVEAKAVYKHAADGLQQAKDYAQTLGLRFAYATNGHGIIEADLVSGREQEVPRFPTPDELWSRLNVASSVASRLLTPTHPIPGKRLRYYQEIAINRAVEAIAGGKDRALLTLATGTGKTTVAFQVCWKLWKAQWNRKGESRPPRILYLADRNILIDQPAGKEFAVFKSAAIKIEGGNVSKSREMYFAIYQAIADRDGRPGLFRQFQPDFFDLIIVDECHRGSARKDSDWREILNYFTGAAKLGMTATPLRQDNRDTYLYFGNPLYTYSLREGIDDGFLAPYRVHRIVTTWDAAGWRPNRDELDRYGRAIPDEEYQTKDFERVVALRARTKAVAKHLAGFLRKHGSLDKTIVFCVDQEHALELRLALAEQMPEMLARFPDYVCRVTADEGDIGRGHLDRFQDIESASPVILTTSQLLTTGVDAPTVKNVVLVRVIGSMTEFKQIIGRGTRLSVDAGKMFFNILDYTGAATRMFADPDFDGEPALLTQEEIDEAGDPAGREQVIIDIDPPGDVGPDGDGAVVIVDPPAPGERRKFYFDGGQVEIAAHLVFELDPDGRQLRVITVTEYTADRVRTLYPNAADLRAAWQEPEKRAAVIAALAERGIDFDTLASAAGQPEADPFDLLCHVAFNAPLRTRRERADRLKRERKDFFDKFGPDARAVLDALLEKYAEFGTAQFVLPDVLEVPPLSEQGNVMEIAKRFGGPAQLREAVTQLQNLLYAA